MNNKLVLLISLIGLFSCKKPYVYPSDTYPVPKQEEPKKAISIWGKFVIIDAVMYVDNHETGEKKVYSHFGPNKTTSSLRWGGSIYEIEEIKKDTTSYSFWPPINTTGYGKFVLNDDTSRHYAVYYVGTSKCIVEDPVRGQSLMGGSARPFSGQTISYKDSTVAMQIQEVEGSIDGYNCRYWTQLTLKKVKSW
jgi:hypothetical protein